MIQSALDISAPDTGHCPGNILILWKRAMFHFSVDECWKVIPRIDSQQGKSREALNERQRISY